METKKTTEQLNEGFYNKLTTSQREQDEIDEEDK